MDLCNFYLLKRPSERLLSFKQFTGYLKTESFEYLGFALPKVEIKYRQRTRKEPVSKRITSQSVFDELLPHFAFGTYLPLDPLSGVYVVMATSFKQKTTFLINQKIFVWSVTEHESFLLDWRNVLCAAFAMAVDTNCIMKPIAVDSLREINLGLIEGPSRLTSGGIDKAIALTLVRLNVIAKVLGIRLFLTYNPLSAREEVLAEAHEIILGSVRGLFDLVGDSFHVRIEDTKKSIKGSGVITMDALMLANYSEVQATDSKGRKNFRTWGDINFAPVSSSDPAHLIMGYLPERKVE